MKRLTYTYIKNKFEEIGYKLLSNKYKNNNIKLKVECSEGHQYEVTYSNFQKGRRCPICHHLWKKFNYEYIEKQITDVGYKILSDKYNGALSKLIIKCDKGHQYKVTYGNFQQGRRCPVCYDIETYSQSEKDCLAVVKQLTNENIIENDRTQIVNPKTGYNLELDIWIPVLNTAIEFNGEHWHESNYSKYKDNQKVKQCKEKNIVLLIVTYQDWIDNRVEQIERLKECLC